ncbi:exopolyphosphatase/guanosine-5'-triphosphate,3'-diphosphate pyrophosphatase [Mumia flava]|uniref:Exopolyphosphatase/guanosine-5'-triphosphate, 3'-diphosphate pyrophosphatase n=1 Tax=Mumia flava TaxID=1348852 RepID=A0A0B2BFU9_9ACTN|nr:Ppx/GppA phosphatase family protein [Mumia flava]PJJ56843.1 exopolyphosphatase/guanosine-5'-triphosphate,3'-diphosphate pyrophosphatase [Mumia flava]
MTRVAAIDCGTNSIRLLIADLGDDGTAQDVVRRMEIVRLGYGVDRTGRLDDAALDRTFAACDAYAAQISEYGAERLRFVATSATRDASNAADFAAGVQERLGVAPDVASGAEEAALSFAGAARDLPDVDQPVLVIDLGGGSTELIVGRDGRAEGALSLDVGSVRMTERHLRDDPPTLGEIESCAADVDAALDGVELELGAVRTVVGVAGTITTVAAAALDLAEYDSERIHHARLSVSRVRQVGAQILAATVEQRRSWPYMHPGRADVIGGGALVLDRVLERTGVAEMIVSEHDILDGIAWSLL